MTVRMRHTRSHTRNRRSHHALVGQGIVTDKKSGNLRLPHRVDEATGLYRGKQIAAPRLEKRASKKEGRGERSQVETMDTNPEPERATVSAEKHEAKQEVKKGALLGKVTKARTNTRSGFGGGA